MNKLFKVKKIIIWKH